MSDGGQLSTFVQICKLLKQQNCISVANGLVTSYFVRMQSK